MEKLIEKANILIEALPYIRSFYGQTFVVKYGGAAMLNEALKNKVAEDLVLMRYVGMNPVIVHGGGPEISAMLERLNITSKFIQGLRVTDDKTMEVVEMVLVGKINKEIVNHINRQGGSAVGLCGKDGNLIQAKKIAGKKLGLVGKVEKIDTNIIKTIIEKEFIPVIAPTAVDKDGAVLNINADQVASEMAISLKANKLIVLTDVRGILKEKGRGELISSLRINEAENLLKKKEIGAGMIPKLEGCIKAVKKGVKKVHIIDGKIPHALLLEIFTDKGIGTQIF